jgi:hypothetical protein
MKNISFILLITFIAACNNSTESTKDADTQADSTTVSGSSQPEFNATDSIEIYFYKDPANQKEFTRSFVTAPSEIRVLAQNLGSVDTTIKECLHDGKMYFYRNGDVFKTVYVSTTDTCRYFAYAINARPYFSPMSDTAYRLINTLKGRAH